MGLDGLEPSTPRLSSVCSNQLSYRPLYFPPFYSGEIIQYSHLRDLLFIWASLRKSDLCASLKGTSLLFLLGKEVIQPQVPLRLPCYDFIPVMNYTVASAPLAVKLLASGTIHSHDVTGGVYKARERIHRDMADSRLLAIPTSWSRVADSNPDYETLSEIGSASQLRYPLYAPL